MTQPELDDADWKFVAEGLHKMLAERLPISNAQVWRVTNLLISAMRREDSELKTYAAFEDLFGMGPK